MDAQNKLAALGRVARALNAAQIVWAVGATALLYLLEIEAEPERIELMVEIADFEPARATLRAVGGGSQPAPALNAACAVALRDVLRVDEVDFDLICDLTIRRKEGTYRYLFDQSRVAARLRLEDTLVPLTPLEDWYVLYQLIPGRAKLVTQISRYFRTHAGSGNHARLNPWLANRLPGDVRERVMKLYTLLG